MPQGSLPYWVTLTMDGRVGLMLVTVVLGTVLLFGLAPALQLSRTSPHAMVKQTGLGVTADRAHRRWTWVFLTAQLALTVILLAKLSITVMQYYVLQTRDPAIDARHILTFAVRLPSDAYRSPDQRQGFFSRLAKRLEDSRGAQSVSVAGSMPFGPGPMRRIVPDTQAILKTTPPVQTATVDSAFFDTLGVRVIEGRAFARDVATDRQSGIIVNQRLAQVLFPGLSAVGRRVRLESAGPVAAEEVRTIIGVVPAFRQQPTFEPDPLAYLPLSPEAMSTATVLVRTDGDMGLLAGAIRDELRALDPNIPANRLMTLEQSRWEMRWNARVSTEILTTVALVALGLSTLGLAALTAYSVAQRRRELGIRLALGASAWQVVALVLRRVMIQVFIGLGFGWLASIGWSRLFDEWGGNGPVNFTIVAVALATVALAMSAWPALRASRIDPLLTLRQE
jgi:predicted permease